MCDHRFDGSLVTVRLDIVDIRELKPYDSVLSEVLCENRRRKMNAYLREDDRLRCLGGGLLMRRALGTDDVLLNQYGKPMLYPDCSFSAIQSHFNLSHSGNFVILALCEETIGVDIEEMRALKYMQISKACFHPDEQAMLERAPEGDRRILFYKLWTLKESYAKAIGLGLSIAPNSYAVCPNNSGGALLSVCSKYRFLSEVFMFDYMLSVCVAAPRELAIVRRECPVTDFLNEN